MFQTFFVERAFKIFDTDGSGDISLAEFIDTMYQFAGRGQAEKILFLFKVYDIDGNYFILYLSIFIIIFNKTMSIYLYLFVLLGDGMIQEEELEEVLRACLQVCQFLFNTSM